MLARKVCVCVCVFVPVLIDTVPIEGAAERLGVCVCVCVGWKGW